MEVRGQENETKGVGFSSYSHQTTGFDRKREGNHNGATVLTCTQTLDHSPFLQRQVSLGPKRSPNTDRVTLTSTTNTQVSCGSNSKPATVRYRECLRNHAASVGGNVFDGCGEFMPSGEEGSLEALKCAACDCHRNFHRKEMYGKTQFSGNSSRRSVIVSPIQLPHHHPLPSPTMLQHHHHQKYSSPSSAIVAPMNVAFASGGSGGGTESSSEDLNVFHSNAEGMPPPPPYVLSKKRFRTKFTQDQKEKMLVFAEKVGWRMQKQDEQEVERFCVEVGVKRQVFKVWMHNNKNNVKKQQQDQQELQEPLPLPLPLLD
ncbi:ZF-HD_dimer domain-containing protein [Cephalotus follicularis]|uniref:ZF-HD_dimer domain-containing protein n=1 Tax=Cephalotus follicularis TaxID=3775 RepID=A0A1Q3CN68_CEPFO|nr:ZF-HD_dimer domain-containing protein [Cephalotus follicularis]